MQVKAPLKISYLCTTFSLYLRSSSIKFTISDRIKPTSRFHKSLIRKIRLLPIEYIATGSRFLPLRTINLSCESVSVKKMLCVSKEFRRSPDERCKASLSHVPFVT